MNKFEQLLKLNVNHLTEKKGSLTYLSWSNAWAEFKKIYPEATYEIIKAENNIPYFETHCGAMVYTKVTADSITYEMWLPVMDHKNKAMRKDQYTMTDINKTIMRCLVKNLAMFGLGLYIYSGEDLPEQPEKEQIDMDSLISLIKSADSLDTLQDIFRSCKDELSKYSHTPDDVKRLIKEKDLMKSILSKNEE